jgi:hypothetical protein
VPSADELLVQVFAEVMPARFLVDRESCGSDGVDDAVAAEQGIARPRAIGSFPRRIRRGADAEDQ